MKFLYKKLISTFAILGFLLFLQACTTVEYKDNLAQKEYLEKEIASTEYKQKQEKLNNLNVELQQKEQEKTQLEEELQAEANKFNEFFAEKMEYEKENFNKFKESFYNHTYNINLIDKDINQSYLETNKIYVFAYDNLVIDKIIDANSIEIKSPFNILDIIATNEVNSKITIDNDGEDEGVVKWESSNSKTPTIIISNYNTKNVLINTKLECGLFEYKGVSKDGKSLLFDCSSNKEEFLKNPKNKEDFIKWAMFYGFLDREDYIIREVDVKQNTTECDDEDNCEQVETYPNIDTYLDYSKRTFQELEDIPELKITKTKLKNILEKNIYYINSQANYNEISKEYSSYLEINNNLKAKIDEKQEAIDNLNNQITELTAEINKPNENINEVNEKLKNYNNWHSIFFPSFASKYTTGAKLILSPITTISVAGVGAGIFVAIAFLPITIAIWINFI